jgi:uroporphyrinogen-III synthase
MSVLAGRVVATTRSGDPEDQLMELLEEEGAAVVSWDTLTIDPPGDAEALKSAAGRIDEYDWVAFTSPRSVEAVTKVTAEAPTRARVAAVGAGTTRALEAAGWSVAVIGSAGAAMLVRGWSAEYDLDGTRVLFPAGSLARSTLETLLEEVGARVERVEAYRTSIVPPDSGRVRADLADGVDVVTFASPSAVQSLSEALGGDWPEALDHCVIVAIGPTTREALVSTGVGADRIHTADPSGVPGLVKAAISALQQ